MENKMKDKNNTKTGAARAQDVCPWSWIIALWKAVMRGLRWLFTYLLGSGRPAVQHGNPKTRRQASSVDPPSLQVITRETEDAQSSGRRGEETTSDDSSVDPTPHQATEEPLRRTVDSASSDAESTVRRRKDTASKDEVVASETRKNAGLERAQESKKPVSVHGNGNLGEFGSAVDQMSFHFNTKRTEKAAFAEKDQEKHETKQDSDPKFTTDVEEHSPKSDVVAEETVQKSTSMLLTSEQAITSQKTSYEKNKDAPSPSKNRAESKQGEVLHGILSSPEKKSKSPSQEKHVRFDQTVEMLIVPKLPSETEVLRTGSAAGEKEITGEGSPDREDISEPVCDHSRQQKVFDPRLSRAEKIESSLDRGPSDKVLDPNSARAEQLGPRLDQGPSGHTIGTDQATRIIKTSPQKQFIVSKVPEIRPDYIRKPEHRTPEKAHPHQDQKSHIQSDANKPPRSPGKKHKMSPCHYTSPDTFSFPNDFEFTEFPIKDNEIGTSPPTKKPCFEEESTAKNEMSSQGKKDLQPPDALKGEWLDNNRPSKEDEAKLPLEKEPHPSGESSQSDDTKINVSAVSGADRIVSTKCDEGDAETGPTNCPATRAEDASSEGATGGSASGDSIKSEQEESQAAAHSKEVDVKPASNPQLDSFDVVVEELDVSRFRGYHQFNDF